MLCLFTYLSVSVQMTGNAIIRYLKMVSISHFRRCQLQRNLKSRVASLADYFDTVQNIVHSSNSRPTAVTKPLSAAVAYISSQFSCHFLSGFCCVIFCLSTALDDISK